MIQDEEDMEDLYQEKHVGFTPDLDEDGERKTVLRRRDTPHHKKGKRIVITDDAKDKVLEILAQKSQKEQEVGTVLVYLSSFATKAHNLFS